MEYLIYLSLKVPNTMQTIRQQATRKVFFDRMAMLSKFMGDRLDDVAVTNFVKLYKCKLLLDEVQETMYRYHNFDPRFAPDGSLIPGNPKLAARADAGWYVTFDKADKAAEAISKAQLPPGSTAQYRLEFQSVTVKDKAYVPYGNAMESPIKEPLTRDFPELGIGGATQLLAKEVEIPLKAIYEDVNGVYVKIWPTP